MKNCTKCNILKPLSEFHKDKATKTGFYPSCIKCNIHRRNNKDVKARYDREYRKTLGWAKAANQYKVSVDFLKNLILSQQELCAICKKPETGKHSSGVIMRLSIDHCHNTGKVRGFLCSYCNRAIGLLRDDTTIIQAAIQYLTKHKSEERSHG